MVKIPNVSAVGWTNSSNGINGNLANFATNDISSGNVSDTYTILFGTVNEWQTRLRVELFVSGSRNGGRVERVGFQGGPNVANNEVWPLASSSEPQRLVYEFPLVDWGLTPFRPATPMFLEIEVAHTGSKTLTARLHDVQAFAVQKVAQDYGREPVTIVQLEQPRCSLRFGTAPCTATGTPKCYQTYWTCKDKANYTPDGFIRWRFMKGEAGILPLYEEDGPDKISTNPLYMLESVSTTSTRINLGASREGESPFGTRAGVRVQLRDQQFDDHVGDFYLADRVNLPERNFWAVWKARNPFYPGMVLTVFEGYRGQPLDQMQTRLYLVNDVQGPDGNGRVTINGDDPLQLADRKRALFPRATDIRLIGSLDETSTAVRVFGLEADIDDTFGNTATSYIRIGSEIIGYTGRTDDGDGEWTLTGVSRAQRGTSAQSHNDGDGCQRVGAFDRMLMFQIAEYLLKEHTQIDNSYINAGGQWDAEGASFLSTFSATATIPDPEPVENLVGELCRDGLFSIWWDEREKVIPLLAVRPPQEIPATINDDLNILADSASLTERPDDRMTRVSVFYGERNPLERDSPANYRNRRIRVDGEVESPEATDGTIRDVEIFSRWIRTAGNAFLLSAQLLLRYRLPPQYVITDLDAKDRDIAVGDVLDVTTRIIRDIEGRPIETRWQVIAADEVSSGSRTRIELQSYQFVGKFGIILPNSAVDHDATPADDRLFGAWFADDATGLMPNGDDAYLFQ